MALNSENPMQNVMRCAGSECTSSTCFCKIFYYVFISIFTGGILGFERMFRVLEALKEHKEHYLGFRCYTAQFNYHNY